MPPGLIEHQDSMSTGRDVEGYLLEVQLHPFAVTPRQHEASALAFSGTDRAKDIGGSCALIFWR